jgi:hypothetical protein
MEHERGLRLTANRALLVVAVVILVLLVLASALVGEGTGSDTGGATLGEAGSQGQAPRDWVTLLVVPLALVGGGYVYTHPTKRAGRGQSSRRVPKRTG